MNNPPPEQTYNDPPPSYSQAVQDEHQNPGQPVQGVHLSPRQLLTRQDMTQVMIEEQWRNLQNNTANTDQEQLVVRQQKKNNCAKWGPTILIIVVIKIVIIICIRSQY